MEVVRRAAYAGKWYTSDVLGCFFSALPIAITLQNVLTKATVYSTSIGDSRVDQEGKFEFMDLSVDEAEHGFEMLLPYLSNVFQGHTVKVIPVLIGSLDFENESMYNYTYYDENHGAIHKSIEAMDRMGMEIIEMLKHCSMKAKVEFIRYDQASQCNGMEDSSPLPTPIFRLEAPSRGLPMYFAGAFGSKIIAMHPVQYVDDHGRTQLIMVTPIFDVRMRSLTYGPQLSEVLYLSNPVFIPIGDNKLLALCGRYLELLNRGRSSAAAGGRGASYWICPLTPDATFSFLVDESKGSLLIGHYSDWMLPFQDRSYFVSELNAWVGLSRCEHTGHLCPCPVVTADSISHRQPWKFSKETVYAMNPAETHIGATLVYTGSESKFCLMECICVDFSYICEGVSNGQEEEGAKSYRYPNHCYARKDLGWHPAFWVLVGLVGARSTKAQGNGAITTAITVIFVLAVILKALPFVLASPEDAHQHKFRPKDP
ncbi:hypothetical protein BAE44_0008114 [Dichanthelium oligosanthes]|uniref:Uncharacterized protein n=1 Tax=Dichanthelium oligosanthes TaxID=888268 RepID=A0A1E5W0L2_9POAL|nr:hypothetical protein BAE44_0008114 [Dichanthelium oligosanthes]